MKAKIALGSIAIGLTLVTSGCVVAPTPGPYYREPVRVAPPPPRVEYVGPPPVTGYIWIDGHWNWSGNRYDWNPGRWEAPRADQRWVPHRWDHDGDNWRLQGGHWEQHDDHHDQHREYDRERHDDHHDRHDDRRDQRDNWR